MLLLGRKTALERVATFLLEMDRRLTVAGMMALPMCRRDIGDYLGLTLETVSRALSVLHDKGILGFSAARQIVLRNRPRLPISTPDFILPDLTLAGRTRFGRPFYLATQPVPGLGHHQHDHQEPDAPTPDSPRKRWHCQTGR